MPGQRVSYASGREPALVDAFFYGLSGRLKDHLTTLDLPSELASKINKRLAEKEMQLRPLCLRSQETSQKSTILLRSYVSIASSGAAPDVEEPMQIRQTQRVQTSHGGLLHLLC